MLPLQLITFIHASFLLIHLSIFQIFFLFQIIQQNIGSVIKGKMDNINKDVIYTDLFISRMRAKIRGLFSAMTRYVHFLLLNNVLFYVEKFIFLIFINSIDITVRLKFVLFILLLSFIHKHLVKKSASVCLTRHWCSTVCYRLMQEILG